ncbi:hypothetical protein C0995_010283 [Termitomyces sp. Mi166|nr:hypothetical protein C0995_010283 [Termitomyces sp. Mi166\
MPRSGDYERLEGGMGSSRAPYASTPPQRRWKWKKLALLAGVVVGVVWFVNRGTRVEIQKEEWKSAFDDNIILKDKPLTAPLTGPLTSPLTSTTPLTSDTSPSTSPLTSDTAPPPAPASYETDPNPSKTTHCASPHAPHLPLVQYALMIDAGSTGSRIHIYKFNNCGPSPSFEWEVFHQTQPGLSSFHLDPASGARSLDVLMDAAVRVVPRALRRCTPVELKATAGLRLLHGREADEILRAVDQRLRERWDFAVGDGAVSIMDGKDEGVYAWITANYLLGTLEEGYVGETYAVLDLGGASTQIAFEPKEGEGNGEVVLDEGDHRFELTIAGKTHVLYQHSYLGYGLMRARKHVHKLVDFMAGIHAPAHADNDREQALMPVIGNPCLAKRTERVIALDNERNVTMVGDDIGSFDACNRLIELVMAKDAICKLKPCSFNGVYQPSILETFPTGPILLLSYFYDRLMPLLPSSSSSSADPDAPLPLHISTISTLARTICAGPSSWPSLFPSHSHPSRSSRSRTQQNVLQDLKERPEYCLDLTFMHALLRLGYEFEGPREVRLAKRVRGTELGWALGAALGLVAADLRCVD